MLLETNPNFVEKNGPSQICQVGLGVSCFIPLSCPVFQRAKALRLRQMADNFVWDNFGFHSLKQGPLSVSRDQGARSPTQPRCLEASHADCQSLSGNRSIGAKPPPVDQSSPSALNTAVASARKMVLLKSREVATCYYLPKPRPRRPVPNQDLEVHCMCRQ